MLIKNNESTEYRDSGAAHYAEGVNGEILIQEPSKSDMGS